MEVVRGWGPRPEQDAVKTRAAVADCWREVYALDALASRIFERVPASVDERVQQRLANGRLTRAV